MDYYPSPNQGDRQRATRRMMRLSVLFTVAVTVAAGCGSSLTDSEVLQASGQRAEPVSNDSGPAPTDAGAIDFEPGDLGSPEEPSSEPSIDPAGSGGEEVGPSTGGTTPPAQGSVGTPGERGPIVIASVGNYSGPAAASFAGIPKAVQIWASKVNASGGLFGRQVQVIVQDDGGDPARYAAAVQDLVENRKVVAFVGQGASLSMPGGTAYLREKQVPVIGNDCSRANWFKEAMYFPTCTDVGTQFVGTVRSGAELSGKKKYGYVYCSEASGCTDFNDAVKDRAADAGVQIVYVGQISLTQVDFTATCRSAQSAGVEVFSVAADASTLARLVRSCNRQGFRPVYTQPSVSTASTSNREAGLDNMILETPIFPFAGGSGAAYDEYASTMGRYGAPQEVGTSIGWASAKLFELAATKAAEADQSITSATLMKALRTISGETLGGLTVPLDFRGSTPTTPPCWFILRSVGAGKWEAPKGSQAQCL